KATGRIGGDERIEAAEPGRCVERKRQRKAQFGEKPVHAPAPHGAGSGPTRSTRLYGSAPLHARKTNGGTKSCQCVATLGLPAERFSSRKQPPPLERLPEQQGWDAEHEI